MRFVGIDLAWSLRKTHKPDTGGVVLDDMGRVVAHAHLTTDDAIVAFVQEHAMMDGCIVGIDAPLVEPNMTGRRPCEAALQRVGIPSYPANRTLFAGTFGGIRGEDLVARLAVHGFMLSEAITSDQERRVIVEVYPRAFITRSFGRIPRYKSPRKENVTAIGEGLVALQRLMLEQLNPPLYWEHPPADGVASLHMRPRDQKHCGDMLDAALSAYLCYLAWHRPERVETIGTIAEGFIMLPRIAVAA